MKVTRPTREPTKTFDDFEEDEKFHSIGGRTVTESDIRTFIGATNETAPEHVDHEYARAHPLIDGVVAQGVLVLGIANSFVAEDITRSSGYALNYGYDALRFPHPVYPGDTLMADLVVKAKQSQSERWGDLVVDITVRNQDDETVLSAANRIRICKSAPGRSD